MKSSWLALALVALPAAAQELPGLKLYVVDGATGGNGSKKAPYGTIGEALSEGRRVAASWDVTIDVAPGVYDAEPRPLVFDYRVTLKGSTVLERDENGIATGAFSNGATVQAGTGTQAIVHVTGNGVTIQGLRVVGAGTSGANAANGFAVDKSPDFRLDGVHVSNVMNGYVISASTGQVRNSYAGGPTSSAAVLNGGNEQHPADVKFVRNRLEGYSTGGLAVQGAADPILPLPREPFHTLTAVIDGNVLSTNQPLVSTLGPSNPYGVRLNVVNDALTNESAGWITARITNNHLSLNHRYPLLITSGQTRREARTWSGDMDLHLKGNEWLPGPYTVSRIIITFTNARVGVADFWPELAKAAGGQEYAEGSTFWVHHHGELDSCLEAAALDPASIDCHVDNPGIEPCDGRVLDNTLVINGEEQPHGSFIPFSTFIPAVCPQ